MAKTLRTRTKAGWTTKASENLPSNLLTPGEIDDNFLALETDIENRQKVYNSVADMVADATLTVGRKVRTLGYYTPGDGGGNDYEIVAAATGTDDGGSYIDLSGISGQAKGLFNGSALDPAQYGVRTDSTDGNPANHIRMQAALDAGFKSFDFGGADRDYIFNGIVGLHDQSFYQENVYYLSANGAKVRVESPTAMLTSKTVADNGGVSLGTNTFAGKIYIRGFSFLGTSAAGVFDGDFLYNVFFTDNHCYGLTVVAKSHQNKGVSFPSGYFQSVYLTGNHFVSCSNVLVGKRAFNVNFNENMCESCDNGLIIDGDGQPAINNIRVTNNIYEGGGLFCSFGDALGGIVEGNYLEANETGGTLTKKCHIDLSYKGGSQFYDWRISRNSAQDSAAQVADPDFQLVSFSGANDTGLIAFSSVFVEGNWSASRVTNFNIVRNSIANRQGDRQSKINMPSSPSESRLDFIANTQTRLNSTNLTGGVYKVVTIDIPDGNIQNRSLALDLNILMQGRTAGQVTTCEALAEIKVLIAATGSGVSDARLPASHTVSAYLTSLTQQPNGTEIDTIGPYNGTILFSNPVVSTERDGTKVHIKLSNYVAASVSNYGAVDRVVVHTTATAYCLTGTPTCAAKWISFTQ